MTSDFPTTHYLRDISTYRATATGHSQGEGPSVSVYLKIDPQEGLILDCKWHSSDPEAPEPVLQFLCERLLGLRADAYADWLPEVQLFLIAVGFSSENDALWSSAFTNALIHRK